MRALLCAALLGLTIPASALAAGPSSSAALRERVALAAPDGSVRSFRTGLAYATVGAVVRHRAPGHLELSVDGASQPLGVTGEHPFWSPDRHRWVPARALAVGDLLSTAASLTRLDGMLRRPGAVEVYNLDVGEPHNYFVYVHRDVVLVHNKDLDALVRDAARNCSRDCNERSSYIARELGQEASGILRLQPRGKGTFRADGETFMHHEAVLLKDGRVLEPWAKDGRAQVFESVEAWRSSWAARSDTPLFFQGPLAPGPVGPTPVGGSLEDLDPFQ